MQKAPRNKAQTLYLICALVPAVLCVLLYFGYNSKEEDANLYMFQWGLLITCVISPLYLSVITCVFSFMKIKTDMKFKYYTIITLIAAAVANFTFILTWFLKWGRQFVYSWLVEMLAAHLISFAVSMAIISVLLLLIYFIFHFMKKRYEKKLGSEN